VGARKLIDILRSMPADQIVSLTANGSKLTCRAARAASRCRPCRPRTSRWSTRPVDFGPAFSVPQKVLKALIDQVHFAMAVHDIRYYLNGILFVAEGKTLTLVATDGTAWPWPRPSWRPTCPSRRSSCRARRCWS
jgi:DNA polymerase-3 subunit beta